jgi:phosphoribosylformylglycinamidine synthase
MADQSTKSLLTGPHGGLVETRTFAYTPQQASCIRVGVAVFPGTLDDRDAARAVSLAGAKPVLLWHGDQTLRSCDAVVLAGGFSYGDYLRCGAIAQFAPLMEKIKDAAAGGMPVLGICNGFQILTESHMLPGALTRNDHQKFICKEQKLAVANNETAWTNAFDDHETITVPLKNGEGRFVADKSTLNQLEAEGRVVFRYVDGNPNGSVSDIAGVTNKAGNVVGLMPHPEHAVERGFGVEDGDIASARNGIDGLKFFQSLVAGILRGDIAKLQSSNQAGGNN